ncbi:MAG: hypothetical protein NTY03_04800 [Candidatus Bathyarchaeota archaeon]|jgi:hypothetical protein|nr:hypothetical protein [Candidatus Bathyarchaeota archaeon]
MGEEGYLTKLRLETVRHEGLQILEMEVEKVTHALENEKSS